MKIKIKKNAPFQKDRRFIEPKIVLYSTAVYNAALCLDNLLFKVSSLVCMYIFRFANLSNHTLNNSRCNVPQLFYLLRTQLLTHYAIVFVLYLLRKRTASFLLILLMLDL